MSTSVPPRGWAVVAGGRARNFQEIKKSISRSRVGWRDVRRVAADRSRLDPGSESVGLRRPQRPPEA